VKPIPVRPISSSASSTHSSSGVAVAVAAAASAASAATNHGIHSLLSKSEPAPADQSFSLIAKYFASFPATRLKASHLEPVSNSCFVAPTTLLSATAADGNQLSNPATPVATLTSVPASTPHHYALPLAHFAAANSATTPVNVTATMATTTGNHLFENSASKHQPTTRFLPFKQVKNRLLSRLNKLYFTKFYYFKSSSNYGKQTTQFQQYQISSNKQVGDVSSSHTHYNPTNSNQWQLNNNITNTATNNNIQEPDNHHNHSHPHHQSTDHLCTNFKRLIKLTDTSQHDHHHHHSFAAIVSRSPSNTPTHQLMSSATVANTTANNVAATVTTQQPNGGGDCDSDSDLSKTRLGQIQMETRSTRKFLIKHHPYLQLISQQQQQLPDDVDLSQQRVGMVEQRPSINFIKMKRLKRKAAARAAAAAAAAQIRGGACGKRVAAAAVAANRAVTRSTRVNSSR
jgi:hypothetical protein